MYEGAVQDLIDELGRLPGVGPKSAQRIAFHLLAADPTDVRRLTTALTEVKERVRFCRVCGNVSEQDECRVCRDPRRDLSVICVVEEPKDVVAIEKTREFRGRYHVLGGAILFESTAKRSMCTAWATWWPRSCSAGCCRSSWRSPGSLG